MSASHPRFRVREVHFSVLPTHTRFPFRYGIAAMTRAPHLFIRMILEVDGRVAEGWTSEGLPPKWFTKNPTTTFEEDDLPGMHRIIHQAARFSLDAEGPASFFDFWNQLRQEMAAWARGQKVPELLSQLGLALMERAVLDALCRDSGRPLWQWFRSGAANLHPEVIHPDLGTGEVLAAMEPVPLRQIQVRHTVGLSDPLLDTDIDPSERVDDGLPQSLEASIAAYGLKWFKIKIRGKREEDGERLRRISRLLEARAPDDWAVTLDGNEQYQGLESFRYDWEQHRSDPALASLWERLLFVEQPIHRDHALNLDPGQRPLDWKGGPRILIDESDSSPWSLAEALKLGYAGTSHKNCKGVLKSLFNLALVKRVGGLLSGEDLANLGPVALTQDLAVAAMLGIGHVERNGHHYFAGLSMFPQSLQHRVLEVHDDLYHSGPIGWPTLAIRDGKVDVSSLSRAPFGHGLSSEDLIRAMQESPSWRQGFVFQG